MQELHHPQDSLPLVQGLLNGEILSRVADLYGTSADYLLCRLDAVDEEPRTALGVLALGDEEAALVAAFRGLGDRQRADVLRLVEGMAEREGGR